MPVAQPHPCYCFQGRCWKKHCPKGKANKESLIERDANADEKDGRSYRIFSQPKGQKEVKNG